MTLREQIEQILKSEKREFWMDTDLLDKALDNCDLGDGYTAKVRQYPHKDMIPELTQVTESSYVAKLESLVRLLPGAVEALDDLYKRHLWHPEMGECICDQHTKAAQVLANIESEVGKL